MGTGNLETAKNTELNRLEENPAFGRTQSPLIHIFQSFDTLFFLCYKSFEAK